MAEPTYQQVKPLYEKLKARLAETETQLQIIRTALGQQHVDQFLHVNDGLELVIQQAEKGDIMARQQCEMLVRRLERARAVVSGIVLPTGSAASNGHPVTGDERSATEV